jgi:tetratricopeptide (TPR) repeat protein
MRLKDSSRRLVRAQVMDVVVVVFTLLAPALGGSTELWAQGVLVIGVALVVALDPPRQLPPAWVWVPALGLAVWPLLSFLPAEWLGVAAYRTELLNLTGLDLGARHTVQPWVTVESMMFWWAGLVWAVVLAGRRWELPRGVLVGLYLAGIVVLTLVALTTHATGSLPSVWNPGHGFGFFPNRNQTANVLALAAIVALAMGLRQLLRGRIAGWTWFGVYLLLGVALVFNGSRAGILLYLGGALVLTIWTATVRRSARRLGWGVASVLGLLTLFMVYGGSTLDRFIRPGEPPPSLQEELLARTDPGAYRLAAEASWHGIGLGNFPAVFPQYAELIAPEKRAIHPESDWVWLWIELGWVPTLVVGAFGLAWLVRNRPRLDQPDFLLRAALALVGALFMIHGLADVPGHRAGSLWPALFLFALLREPLKETEHTGEYLFLALRPQALAVPLVTLAFLWLLPPESQPMPSSALASTLHDRMELGMTAGAHASVISDADRLLEWSKLDVAGHFYRGLAGAYGNAPIGEVIRDFDRAQWLDRRDPRLALYEGNAWLFREPNLSFPAWVEALQRAGPNRAIYFRDMLIAGAELPLTRHELFSLAFEDPLLMIEFLQYGPPEEFQEEVDKWLIDDPDLARFDPDQRRVLLTLWARKGNLEGLMAWLEAHPRQVAETWLARAIASATAGDFRKACELAAAHAPVPRFPKPPAARSQEELQRRLLLDPSDPTANYGLYLFFEQEGQTDEALRVLQRAMAAGPVPSYVLFIEAQLLHQKQAWDAAWKAYERFLRQDRLPSLQTVPADTAVKPGNPTPN